jgi:transcriptional regulator GlxA family with amidase domain
VERLRVECARTLLMTTTHSIKRVAHDSGFATPARMRRAFERELGVGPSDLRLLSGA